MDQCTCPDEVFLNDCPRAFCQDGKWYHADNTGVNAAFVAQPGLIGAGLDEDTMSVYARDIANHLNSSTQSPTSQALPDGGGPPTPMGYNQVMPAPLNPGKVTKQYTSSATVGKTPMFDFKNDNRGTANPKMASIDEMSGLHGARLEKFSALSLNGMSLSDYAIGGYQMDKIKTMEKIAQIVPLPGVALPIIFCDKELNFYHHFMSGVEKLIGQKSFYSIIDKERYDDFGEVGLVTEIAEFSSEGYKETDDASTILVKTVLQATFETVSLTDKGKNGCYLRVVANLYGLQYIEPNLQMRDADVFMWLKICNNHHQTIWFNTFKGSGIPRFAKGGVHDKTASSLVYRVVAKHSDPSDVARRHKSTRSSRSIDRESQDKRVKSSGLKLLGY